MNNYTNQLIILLTGTINPNSFSNITIKDPRIRRQQYLDAIDFYIKKTKFKIVFAENSGDILEKFPIQPDRIEYLTFKSKPIEPDRGIGYKELELIDFAFQNSNFLKNTRSVVKITGRLKILNINSLSRKFLKNIESKSNLTYANSFHTRNMDSRCFFFTVDFWPYLKNAGKKINLKYIFEICLWDAIYHYQSFEVNNYVPLNTPLRVKGVSGSYGIKYRHNIFYHYARFIRNLGTKLFKNSSNAD